MYVFNESTCPAAVLAQCVMPNALLTSSGGGTLPFREYGHSSIGFLIICSALVMIMTPGVGLLYSGLLRTRFPSNMMMLTFLAYAVVAIQWLLIGFSLAYSDSSNSSFLGDAQFAFMVGVSQQAFKIAPAVPVVVFAVFEMQFATLAGALVLGSMVKRVGVLPASAFIFVWTTLIYCPIGYWVWSYRGWARNMNCISSTSIGNTPCGEGMIDFAGGGPVHMTSGAATLAINMFMSNNKKPFPPPKQTVKFRALHLMNIVIGTMLVFFGWFAFNAGSASASSPRAVHAGSCT